MGISKLNPSAGGIPFGNTAGRPTAATGKLYSNGETARLELYTSSGAWENIVQEVPGVSSIGGQYLETNNSNTITIYGTNFVSGASAFAIGTNAAEVAATSTTFNSLVQLSAVFTGLTAANEPYDIKVVNPSNLFGILPDTLFVNNQVSWTTSAGSLGTFGDAVAISVSAIASDDSTITYAVASGSSLPSGVTLNTATGLISGTLPDVASSTTYTFTLTASDGSNPTVSRQFSILSNAAPVWVTSAGSLGSYIHNTSISTTALSATDTDSVTYALASGSSLPAGLTLSSSTGVISGTLPTVNSDTVYNFTVNANDGVNAIPRAFSITSTVPVSAELLVIAGGGGGGSQYASNFEGGCGGGAGGLISTTTQLSRGSQYLVTIGNGGAYSNANSSINGSNGANSLFNNLVAIGGGVGGGSNNSGSGAAGGSGGGSPNWGDQPGGVAQQPTSASGGYGNAGGRHPSGIRVGAPGGGGGGGGAGSVGGDAPSSYVGGNGGSGFASSITGLSVTYAGGGGGYGPNGSGSGSAGGGNGGTTGTNGTANYGGGGGGSQNGNSGAGGSGVIIIAFPSTSSNITTIPGALTYTLDTTTRTGYKVYKFTAGTGTVTF